MELNLLLAELGKLAVGPYGRIGFEIQGGSRSLAIVNYAQQKRLDFLSDQRSAKAKRGEPAHDAEREAKKLEKSRAEALALARVFAAAPRLLERLELAVQMFRSDRTAMNPDDYHAAIRGMDAVIAEARGE